MKRWLIVSIVFLGLLAPAAAFWQSRDSNYNRSIGGAAPAYVGPGDAVSGAAHCWALRACLASYANGTNSLIDMVAVTGGAAVCTLRVSTAGSPDLSNNYCSGTTPAAACAAASGGGCKASQIYDQISGSPINLSQATLAAMPGVAFSGVGLGVGRVALVFSGAQLLTNTSLAAGLSQPFSFNSVALSSIAIGGILADTAANSAEMIFGNSADQALIYAGGTAPIQAAINHVWHSLTGIFNGSSSFISVDGSAGATANAGAGNLALIRMGEDSFGDFLTGNITTAIIYPSAVTSANATTLFNNEKSYEGF